MRLIGTQDFSCPTIRPATPVFSGLSIRPGSGPRPRSPADLGKIILVSTSRRASGTDPARSSTRTNRAAVPVGLGRSAGEPRAPDRRRRRTASWSRSRRRRQESCAAAGRLGVGHGPHATRPAGRAGRRRRPAPAGIPWRRSGLPAEPGAGFSPVGRPPRPPRLEPDRRAGRPVRLSVITTTVRSGAGQRVEGVEQPWPDQVAAQRAGRPRQPGFRRPKGFRATTAPSTAAPGPA